MARQSLKLGGPEGTHGASRGMEEPRLTAAKGVPGLTCCKFCCVGTGMGMTS